MVVARSQTLVQLTDELVALLDQRAAAEQRSRSELIREAIERYVAADRGAEISRRIVSGYEQIPQEGDDLEAWARRAGRDLVLEERW
ncbi:MAG: ribbon-helix-helix protein, CopG family [Actinobacteria bacterium]|nr:MAG: ribbon-helix-helix protein, CopG family [Actinomycetota bacterium]